MAGTQTYTLIQEQVLASPTNTVTLSNIPATYEDLLIEVVATNATTAANFDLRINGDTSNAYSYTYLAGSGSAAVSGRASNTSYIGDYGSGISNTEPRTHYYNIMSYSNSNVFKTILARGNGAGSYVEAYVGLWSFTTVVNSVTLLVRGGASNIASGSTFRLYGVLG